MGARVCVCVYACVHVYVCVCVYLRPRVRVCVCVYVSVCEDKICIPYKTMAIQFYLRQDIQTLYDSKITKISWSQSIHYLEVLVHVVRTSTDLYMSNSISILSDCSSCLSMTTILANHDWELFS